MSYPERVSTVTGDLLPSSAGVGRIPGWITSAPDGLSFFQRPLLSLSEAFGFSSDPEGFSVEVVDLLDHLSGVFDKAPAAMIDGCHVLAEPVYMTIDAETVALSRKAPKQKPVLGAGQA
ncbi:hypothetical protein ABK249_20865 [Neorhizobium sp. Rsf11]|uniref:Uncharacterized protein n=1 Tax=Neorhizobium phenanthreniclasticum TaxID=3157917 RepID=A0ABV0M682_9HYPH